ncbi:hypothetical protein V496_05346 [Pseudogymnoascus sp. VKM F-4515 (FW-2607)]|nr:hypothetical protein V496_05346 [Pseudogymnoascus sp. VKM F-4515 (FW-2607)]
MQNYTDAIRKLPYPMRAVETKTKPLLRTLLFARLSSATGGSSSRRASAGNKWAIVFGFIDGLDEIDLCYIEISRTRHRTSVIYLIQIKICQMGRFEKVYDQSWRG